MSCVALRSPLFRTLTHASPEMALAAMLLLGAAGCGVSPSSSSGGGAAPIAATAGPQLGYIWNSSERSLRPILGVPGAAQIGQSVVPAGQYFNAATTNSIALLEDASGYSLMALPSGTPVRLSLPAPTSSTTINQLRLSPGGTSAVVFSPGAATLTLVTGLSLVNSAGTNQAHSLTAPGVVSDAVVSDAGSTAVLVGQKVTLMSATGSTSNLATLAGSAAGLSFLAASAANPDDLLIADTAANTLTLVRSVASSPSSATLPTGTLLKTPAAVSASLSGHWAAVANSADASLVRVDLSGQAPAQKVACACQPTLITPLADDGYFRITGPPAQAQLIPDPLWIADATATPRTLFIPAVAGASGATASSTAHSTAAALHQSAAVKLGVR